MPESHLLPEHLDFLLDGDEGFVSYPLRKHLQSCPDCRASLERARAINEMLERLPHAAPRADFANQVMSRVQVFEPWYVSVADSARRLVPRTGPWRVVAAASAAGATLSVTAIAIWLTTRVDLAVYAGQIGWTRLQSAAIAAGSALISNVFGDSALAAVRSGGATSLAIGGSALVVSLAGATFGLRGLIAAARRRSS